MDEPEILDLVERSRKGDREAIDRLFALYRKSLQGWCRRRIEPGLRAKIDEEDLIQSACRQAVEALPDFNPRGPGSFYRWLCRILDRNLNAKRDHFYAQKRSVGRERAVHSDGTTSAPGEPPLPAAGPGPATQAEASETARIVWECVEELEEPLRTILLLEREGKTSPEIAHVLGKAAATVRSLRIKARQKLEPVLRARLGTWPPPA